MPSNDDCVMGVPSIQCPSCSALLEVNYHRRIDKFSKAQRRKMHDCSAYGTSATDGTYQVKSEPEDLPSEAPERNFVLTSCSNTRCDQYNKFKILELPRIKTSTVKVEL